MVEPSHLGGLAGFRRALRQFLAFSETVPKGAGITARQYQALLALKTLPEGQTTVADLAVELRLKHHSAVGLTKRMEKAGLVTRARAPENRRHVILKLTASGDDLLERLAALHRAELLRHGPLIQASLERLC